ESLALAERRQAAGDRRPVLDSLEALLGGAEPVADRHLVRLPARHRLIERDRATRGAGRERLEHGVRGGLGVARDLADSRRALVAAGELGDRLVDLADPLLEPARKTEVPDTVAEVAAQLAEHRRRRERHERDPALGVEAVDGVDQAEARDLEQIL